jgi:hypothetical protein
MEPHPPFSVSFFLEPALPGSYILSTMHVLWHVVGENGQLTTVARVLLSSATNQAAEKKKGVCSRVPDVHPLA